VSGLLVVISGPGGVGKDTLIEHLRAADPQLIYAVSYTTRPRRDYEVEAEHYRFVDEAHFWRLDGDGELMEHARVNGYLYGTSNSRVEQSRAEGFDVILKIEVQGAEQVRRRIPDAITIFISPPSMEELMRRRQTRASEPTDVIEARQRLAELEMAQADRYDHRVVNDDPDRAVAEILAILDDERQRRAAADPPPPASPGTPPTGRGRVGIPS
jgi:guanylate kinase